METTRPEVLVERETGHEFLVRFELAGKWYRVLGVGSRRMHLLHVYAVAFALEEEAEQGIVAGFFEEPGFVHRNLQGQALARALAHDQRLFVDLVDPPFDKAAELVFHHHVKAERMREEFAVGLRKAMPPGAQHRIDKLSSLVQRDFHRGDRIVLRTRGNSVLFVDLDGPHEVDDAPVAQALWSVFLGPESVTPTLKESIALRIAESGRLLEQQPPAP